MDEIIIEQLKKDNIKELDELTEILYNWWGKEEGYSIEAMKELIKSRCSEKDVPVVYIAKINDSVVGTLTLVANDMEFKQDLYPVITSLFVKEEYRKLGISRKLVEELVKHCKNKFDNIYLSTELEGFYEKLGFEYVETCNCYYIPNQDKILCGKVYRKSI